MSYDAKVIQAPPVHVVLAQLASTLEACAYSLAGSCETETVSQIILLGAQADRLARKLADHPQAKHLQMEQKFLCSSARA